MLKAAAVGDSKSPPTTGWKFYNCDTAEYEDDATATCTLSEVPSPPCLLTLTLTGSAKEFQARCEGEYKSTGLFCNGRQVTVI